MFLIEHLAGSTIESLLAYKDSGNDTPDAYHYDEGYRLNVLAELLEGTVKQIHSGLVQKDMAPRNVMLVPGPSHGAVSSRSVPRVVLLDYSGAIVYPLTKQKRYPH